MASSEKLYSTEAIPRERRISVHRRVSGATKPDVVYSKDLEVKTTLQELLIYIIFLIDICILSFGMVNSNMYVLNKAMANLFLETVISETDRMNFKTLMNMADFWKFAEGPLLDGLFWKTWYNNKTLSANESYIYYENLLLGVAQIRQVRVRDNTCPINPYFRYAIQDCYSSYGPAYEDKDSFGFRNGTAWLYSDPDVSEWHWGYVSLYSSGGYKLALSRVKDESREMIRHLKQNSWLTRATRATFVDFSVYNANLNLFCVIRLLVEFPATGGAVPSWQFYAVKLIRYVSFYDYFLASCEVIFCIFICTFFFQEIMKLKKYKGEYFKSIMNWLDMLLVLISFVAIVFNMYRTIQVSQLLENLLHNPSIYPNFHFLAFWQTRYNDMIAVNVFFAWIKIFKFIRFNKTMSQLSSTLSRCAKDILGFAVMFFFIFFSYAQLGYLIFGTQVDEFSSFQDCIFTQFRIILGDFNFADIEQANRVLGPIYFITFVFFVFFVLLNMFLAIINDTYSEVKADFSVEQSEFEIGDLIRQSYERALVKLKLKKATVEDIHNRVYDPLGSFTLQPLDEEMKTKGYSAVDANKDSKYATADGEFSKYDLEDKEGPFAQRQKWRERLWQNYYSPQDDNQDTGLVTQQEYQMMVKRSAELEKKLSEVTVKVEGMVKQKEKEKPESKQKETGDEITEL